MREELVRRVTVTSLRQEEMKTVIRTRFPKLEDLTEKIMRIISPKDHNHYPYQVKLVNTLRSSRQVNVRDLLKWCTRAQDTFTGTSPASSCQRFSSRMPWIYSSGYHRNITVHKPAISLKFSGLQVGECLSPCHFLPHPYPPLSVLCDPPPCDQDGAWCRKDED